MRELSDLDRGQKFLLQGFALARLNPVRILDTLQLAHELVSEGHPMLPTGWISDLLQLISGEEETQPLPSIDQPEADAVEEDENLSSPEPRHWQSQWHPNSPRPAVLASEFIPRGVARLYEDHVLGKFYSDSLFERGSRAVHQLQGEERNRGLIFLLDQIRERQNLDGIQLGTAPFRQLLKTPPEDLIALVEESLQQPMEEELGLAISELIRGFQSSPDLLTMAAVWELERGSAGLPFSDRLALRQILQATELVLKSLPLLPPRSLAPRENVVTQLLDEDEYPVGGYSSISNRGSIESLLHSQLAYMESGGERPDLFDIKFVRNELLYFSRDENSFLRRRRTIWIVLSPDLDQLRLRDPGVPYQRLVMVLGGLVAALYRLEEWLNEESLIVRVVWLEGPGTGLETEFDLLHRLWKPERERGWLLSSRQTKSVFRKELLQRPFGHVLQIGQALEPLTTPTVESASLHLLGEKPIFQIDQQEPGPSREDRLVWEQFLEWVIQ